MLEHNRSYGEVYEDQLQSFDKSNKLKASSQEGYSENFTQQEQANADGEYYS